MRRARCHVRNDQPRRVTGDHFGKVIVDATFSETWGGKSVRSVRKRSSVIRNSDHLEKSTGLRNGNPRGIVMNDRDAHTDVPRLCFLSKVIDRRRRGRGFKS